MSRFAWEPPTRLRLGDAKPRPRTASDLLEDLGLETATSADQRGAVNNWLRRNPDADELMRLSLRRKGLPSAELDVQPRTQKARVTTGSTILAASDSRATMIMMFPRKTVEIFVGFSRTSGVRSSLGDILDPVPDFTAGIRKRDGQKVA